MKIKLLPKFILSLGVIGVILTIAISLFSYRSSRSYLENLYAQRVMTNSNSIADMMSVSDVKKILAEGGDKTEEYSEMVTLFDKLKKDGYIRVADIAKRLKVTAVTVRKDFKALEEQGLLFRTHGSACPVNPHVADRSVQLKELENRVQKEKIAQAATQLLEENDSVIIATGSTIMAFAEKIVPKGTLNVVTPSLKVSMLLSAVGNVNIIQLGGVVHKKSLSVRGTSPLISMEEFSCSKLFIGADGINEEYGVTNSNLEEAQLNREMMKAASKTIVLVDSSKFSRKGFGRICPLSQIHTVVTDGGIHASTVRMLEEQGVEVIIAE